MIIKVFKVSEKAMYTFPNKETFYNYVIQISGCLIPRCTTIKDLMGYLPVEDYCRVK